MPSLCRLLLPLALIAPGCSKGVAPDRDAPVAALMPRVVTAPVDHYTDDPAIKSGAKFMELGIQIAAGVPLRVDEPDSFMTFRIGLFGLDKLYDVPAALARLQDGIDRVFP